MLETHAEFENYILERFGVKVYRGQSISDIAIKLSRGIADAQNRSKS